MKKPNRKVRDLVRIAYECCEDWEKLAKETGYSISHLRNVLSGGGWGGKKLAEELKKFIG